MIPVACRKPGFSIVSANESPAYSLLFCKQASDWLNFEDGENCRPITTQLSTDHMVVAKLADIVKILFFEPSVYILNTKFLIISCSHDYKNRYRKFS